MWSHLYKSWNQFELIVHFKRAKLSRLCVFSWVRAEFRVLRICLICLSITNLNMDVTGASTRSVFLTLVLQCSGTSFIIYGGELDLFDIPSGTLPESLAILELSSGHTSKLLETFLGKKWNFRDLIIQLGSELQTSLFQLFVSVWLRTRCCISSMLIPDGLQCTVSNRTSTSLVVHFLSSAFPVRVWRPTYKCWVWGSTMELVPPTQPTNTTSWSGKVHTQKSSMKYRPSAH